MTGPKLTLREMCTKFNVTPRTLRHYEYIELLAPEKDGRTRFYGPRECARLELILRGRRFGFSLEEARQWLDMYDLDPSHRIQMEKWVQASGDQIAQLESQLAELEKTIAELKALRAQTVANLLE
jgi:DNA-binding transcriptional MerR regulator